MRKNDQNTWWKVFDIILNIEFIIALITILIIVLYKFSS